VAFRFTLGVVRWAEVKPKTVRPRLLPGAVVLLFVVLCLAFYRLCLDAGYPMAWTFLTGFVPAAPAAVVAVRARRWWLWTPAEAVSFTAFFWVAGLLPGWKDSLYS